MGYIRLVVVRARAEDDVADLVHRANSSEETGKTRANIPMITRGFRR